MVASRHTPDRGDLVWLNFSPQAGHEQSGRRPALVISRLEYNRPTGLALMCPITSRKKGYPFEVELPDGPLRGVVLSDQVRCLDWKARRLELVTTVDERFVADVAARIEALIR